MVKLQFSDPFPFQIRDRVPCCTASRLAIRPYSDSRLKCAAASGAVARPATAEEITSIATGRKSRGTEGATRDHGS